MEKTPGTPRREGGAGKDRAVQDPVLRDYVGLPLSAGQNTVANIWDRLSENVWAKEHLVRFIRPLIGGLERPWL